MVRKTPSLQELLTPATEVVYAEGLSREEINASGDVHVWTENPEHNLGKLHPDFKPQAPNPDCVGYSNE